MKPEMAEAAGLPKISAPGLLVLAVMCLVLAAPAQAAKKSPTDAPAAAAKHAPDARLPNDDIAEAMLSRAKPSDKDNAAVLLPLTGAWDYQQSFWTDPKAEPAHAMGTVTNEMVLDGRFLSSKALGSLNIGREQIPFEGQELIGFDNAKKSLSFVAVDTLTTGVTTGSGKLEETKRAAAKPEAGLKAGETAPGDQTRVIRETGRFTNPLTGVEQAFRAELTFVDADHYQRSVFAPGKSGKETKLSETDYARRK